MTTTTKDQVEAVYGLSPLQQGMLFHSLYATDVSTYIVQLTGVLRGPLDTAAFQRAWQRVVDRHPALRTAFVWEGLKQPRQVVGRKVVLHVEAADWSALSPDEQTERLESFLWDDRCRGFALYRAPLMRVTLIRLDEGVHRFVWSHHHLLLDGWSLPLVLRDLIVAYTAFAAGVEPELPASRPYQDYIRWLAQQSKTEAEAYWRGSLAGATSPTPLTIDRRAPQRAARQPADKGYFYDVPPELVAAIGRFAREQQITVNTVLQAAWGQLLSRYSGRNDVLFGVTVSGRPFELTGAESMIGLFINTVPERLRVPADAVLGPWLKSLHTAQLERHRFEHVPLFEIQPWSELPRGAPMFESLYLFENYPLDEAALQSPGGVRFEDVQAISTADFPLALVVVPGRQTLVWRFGYNRQRFDERTIQRMAAHLQQILLQWIRDPMQRLDAVTLGPSAVQLSAAHADWLADIDGRPAPEGVPGELVLGQRDFGGNGAARSGIIARELSDGTIERLGDRQQWARPHALSYNGWDLEAVLRTFDGVNDVAAWIVDGERGPRYRIAVVPTQSDAAFLPRVRRQLQRELPEIDRRFQLAEVTQLPRTANGEIDWSKLSEATAVDAGASRRRSARAHEEEYDALCRRTNLTKNQLLIWAGVKLQPDLPLYNLTGLLTISGPVDRDRMERALQSVIAASDAWRTVFCEEDGVPRQVVLEAVPFALDWQDFSQSGDPDRAARDWGRRDAITALPLSQPLFRATLFKLADDRFALLVTQHHLLADMWSVPILIRHLARAYERPSGDDDASALVIPAFADHVQEEHESRETPAYLKAREYWLALIDEDAPPLFDGAAGVGGLRSGRLSRVRRMLSSECAQRLRAFAARPELSSMGEHAAFFVLFATALVTWLYRRSGHDRIVFGTSFANRMSLRDRETLGCFMQIAPLAFHFAGDETFASLMRQVNRTLKQALRHRRYTVGNPPQRRLYDVLLNYHSVHQLNDARFDNAPARAEWIPSNAENDALALQVSDFDKTGSFVLEFDFHCDVFDDAAQCEAVTQFLRTLDALLACETTLLRDVDLLSHDEHRRILADWGRGPKLEFADVPAIERFARRAAETPDAPALQAADCAWSYRELHQQVQACAAELRRRGVGSEVPVAISLPRSPELIVSLLAVLQAGGAYVPIDPEYPAERRRLMLADSRAALLLTSAAVDSIAEGEWQTLDVPTLLRELPRVDCDANCSPAPAQLAYMIFTSGSTGRPKGVQIPQRALTHFAAAAAKYLDVAPHDRVLQFASISFDAAVEEIFATFVTGACLVLRTESMLDSVQQFLAAVQRLQITVLDLPTAFWHQIVDELAAGQVSWPDCVRVTIIGGERAQRGRWDAWRRHVGSRTRLLNSYGPTETTVVATVSDLTHWDPANGAEHPPIGRPIANMEAYVLDRWLQPLPAGLQGELYLGGLGLARGYGDAPEPTASQFVPHPFSTTPGARLYRTGDRAAWRTDGQLEFLGRVDHQVKIRGFRIEPAEIETLLRSHPAIREAVVLAIPGNGGEHQLVAYVVPADVSSADQVALVPTLRAHLAERLPAYLTPAAIVVLNELPLTPANKIDRKALAAREIAETEGAAFREAPRTPLEQAVADIWCDVLGLADIGVEDSFFELGGHSLLATQLISRLNRRFDMELPLRELFAAPTVAGCAAAITLAQRGVRLAPISRVSRAQPLPLSFPQERLWFFQRLVPGDTSYNIPLAIRLRGPIDRDALVRAFNEIVRRHEVLRTTFEVRNDRPQLEIAVARPVEVPVVDLTGGRFDSSSSASAALDGRAALQQLLQTAANKPFDLQTGPLLRPMLVVLGPDDVVLLLAVHHVAWDGWSMGVFVREMAALYPAFAAGLSSPLMELPIQYTDFAAWQRDWLQGETVDRLVGYWRAWLADAPLTVLPTDRPRPPVRTYCGAVLTKHSSSDAATRVAALARDSGTTTFMVLVAALQSLIARYTGDTDIVVGTPIANRNRPEIEPLIGLFVNTLVLRTQLNGNPTFRESLERVKETTLGAYAHQDLPFDLLVERLQPRRDPSLHPFFQILATLQNAPAPSVPLAGGLSVEVLQPNYNTAKFDLSLIASEAPDGLTLSWEYNTDLFDAATIERLADQFLILLAGAVAAPDTHLADLPLLTPDEQRLILGEWNATATDFSRSTDVAEWFARQAEQTPEATALIAGDVRWTYAALNARANQTARLLQQRGAKPDVLVGVLLERSPELIVSVLAILKAGAAYVPLDPAAPASRLATMLADSPLTLVVTKSRHVEQLTDPQIARLVLDSADAEVELESSADFASPAGPEHLFYGIFTSGSTGRPKLAGVTRRGFANLLSWFVRDFEMTDADRVLLVSSFNFDLTQKNLYATLVSGGALVLHSCAQFDPAAVRADIANHRITLLNCTPSAFYPVVEGTSAAALRETASLRYVFLGGEPIALPRLRPWLRSPDCRAQVVNTYGPTECSDICAFHRVTDLDSTSAIPIGRAVPNTRLYVLDDALRPLPLGAVGELCVGGIGVGRGYLGDVALTLEKFLPDPFGDAPGARLYRTGDMVRYRSDGTLEYLGRRDFQVKIRGHRIELGDIEAALQRNPAVREAVVVVQEEETGEKWLAAYVVPKETAARSAGAGIRDSTPLTEADLRRGLRGELPESLVPAAFVVLPELPLSPNGKVDRRALPPVQRSRGTAVEYRAPTTAQETAICEVLAELLHVERVGVRDNFFELGGDSILAIQVIARLQRRGWRLTPLMIFQQQTVGELATVAAPVGAVDAEQGAVTGPVPLLPVQKHYFAANAVDEHHFNHPFLFAVDRALDAAALRQAVEILLAHHDALRLRYEKTDTGWTQRNAGLDESPVDRVFYSASLADLPEDAVAARIEAECAALQTSFDLTDGPLLRVAWFDLGDERGGRLFLAIHHLIVDAVSWRILMDDLLTACAQLAAGGSVALPPKSTSFRQWCLRIDEYAHSPDLRSELSWWLAEPAQSVLPLPVDREDGENDVASLDTVMEQLSQDETQSLLRNVPAAFRSQINHALLAALARALADWTGQPANWIELEGHGREALFDDVDVSRTVGWFTARFPVLVQADPTESPAASLRAMKLHLERLPNRGIGYGLLRYSAGDAELSRRLAALANPQVTFNYLGVLDEQVGGGPVRLATEPVGPAESPRRRRPQLLEIISSVVREEFRAGFSYSRNVHDRETIVRLAQQFIDELRSLIRASAESESGRYQAADFPLAKVSQQQLDKILANVKKQG